MNEFIILEKNQSRELSLCGVRRPGRKENKRHQAPEIFLHERDSNHDVRKRQPVSKVHNKGGSQWKVATSVV
jgi:hypothetical protein